MSPWRKLLLITGFASVSASAVVASDKLASAAPPCPARYTVQGGVVFDNDTKLRWQQGFTSNLNASQAAGYCATLNLGGGGFRLPTVFELQTIVDESRPKPLIDDAAFPMTPSDIFWSSTPMVAQEGISNWYVNFGITSYEIAGTKAVTESHYVRCVR
jgi:Protein of unknown function (DUF1566)